MKIVRSRELRVVAGDSERRAGTGDERVQPLKRREGQSPEPTGIFFRLSDLESVVMRWCVIPARGGSKRIPRKNIRPFCGQPIIARSIAAALDSGLFRGVVVSTEDDEIAEVAIAAGASVPFVRSSDRRRSHSDQPRGRRRGHTVRGWIRWWRPCAVSTRLRRS